MDNFEKVVKKNVITALTTAKATASKLTVTGIARTAPGSKKVRINLCGITGSGKTTTSERLTQILQSNGYKVLVVSADAVSKTGKKGKEMQNVIYNNIRGFDNQPGNFKAVIMDLCNESGTQTISFGYNFSDYEDFTFFPNLDLSGFDDYEAWCLHNVISRPLHTDTCNYWLNPVSAGLDTCIKVHNAKAAGVAQQAGYLRKGQIPNLSKPQLDALIAPKVARYTAYLSTRNLNNEILKFLVDAEIIQSPQLDTKPSATEVVNNLSASLGALSVSSSPGTMVAGTSVATAVGAPINTEFVVVSGKSKKKGSTQNQKTK